MGGALLEDQIYKSSWGTGIVKRSTVNMFFKTLEGVLARLVRFISKSVHEFRHEGYSQNTPSVLDTEAATICI